MTVGYPTSHGLGQSLVPVPEVTDKQPAHLEASGTQKDTAAHTTDSPAAVESPASPAAVRLTLSTAFNCREALESDENA